MPSVNDAINSLELQANPFMDDAPLASIFPGAGRKSVLDQLQHLAQFSSDISALVGPEGSGKTIIGEFFVRQAHKDQMVARISGNLLTSPAALLSDILNVFVINYSQDATVEELQNEFLGFAHDAHARARSVVLIVDDAHELGDEAFGMLVRLALSGAGERQFHLLMLGQQALVDMLECTCPMKNGRNQFTVSQLEPFSLEDTKNYLRFRLNSEGFGYGDAERPLPFTARQLERIYKLSGGIPGIMHGLAAFEFNTPSKGAGDVLAGVWASFPRQYAYGVLGLFIVLGGVVLSLGLVGPESDEQVSISLPSPLLEEPLSREATDVGVQPAVTPVPSPFIPAPILREVAQEESVVSPESVVANSVESVNENTLSQPEPEPPISTPAPTPADSVAVVPQPVVEPAVEPVPTVASGPMSVSSLPGNQYTIQLLGASSKANIDDFLRRNAGNPLYSFESRNRGRPWYVVIHGTYETRALAQRAVAALGPNLAVDQPWIRQISAVQADIAP